MLLTDILLYGADILLIVFATYLFFCYFNIFFGNKRRAGLLYVGCFVFVGWQIVISNVDIIPAYVNISITILITLIATMIIYEGDNWNKLIFSIAFNAIWMMMETLSGYLLMLCCEEYATVKVVGSFISKIFFGTVIWALQKIYINDEFKELSTKYSIMLVLIPIGSIYIMNNIFMFGYRVNNDRMHINSAMTALILFGINVLIFYIYIKLAEDWKLRQINSVYEKQLDLYERHQQERELSALQLRDIRHNMKNNLVSILAYAEKGECEEIVEYVNEIMETGGMKKTTIANSGNIVIDSLISYWSVVAQKEKITFSANLNIPMTMPFKGADICLVLGNLLENAVEAASKVTLGTKRYISVRLKYDKNNLLLYVENSFEGKITKNRSGKIATTKSDTINHGIGLSSVNRVVSRYNGIAVIDDSVKNRFLVKVILYGMMEKTHE